MPCLISCTLLTDQLFNLEFQFESIFNLEFQLKFGIQLGIPISVGINLGECARDHRPYCKYKNMHINIYAKGQGYSVVPNAFISLC